MLAAVLFISLLGTVTLASSATTPTADEIQQQIDELNAKYDAMPPLTDPEALQERMEAYEREFAAIGFEAPNGQPVTLDPKAYVPNFPPPGIRPAVETLPGYRATTSWVGESDGQPVMVTSVVAEASPMQGGVIVDTVGGPGPFIPSPVAVGAITIVSANGALLNLRAAGGMRFVFDVSLRAFA